MSVDIEAVVRAVFRAESKVIGPLGFGGGIFSTTPDEHIIRVVAQIEADREEAAQLREAFGG